MALFEGTRYEGKPLLRLLELYVLWSIDQLPREWAEVLERMTPQLHRTWNCNGSWQECIALVMNFPPEMPDLIGQRWSHNRDLAGQGGHVLDPNDFAAMFVDANFNQPHP